MICPDCVGDLAARLAALHSAVAPVDENLHHSVAGAECVFCERILSTAVFSLRRWIFGVCADCACGLAKRSIRYLGASAQSYEF